jgi:2-keto-4-pentenoate hydratase
MLGLDQRLRWPAVGWKIGAASEEVRRLEGMPSPSPGRLYRDRIFASSAEIPASLFINYRETECEFAFSLGRDLSPRNLEYAEAEVAEAVDLAFPVLEIGDMVFADWYWASGYFGPSLDNGGGAALVYGQPIVSWESRDLGRAHVELRLNGRFVKDGFGSAAMGNPLTSLTWMANWASGRGIGLKQGEVISTGTITGHCFVAGGDQVVADFGPLGRVEVNYALPHPQNGVQGR